MVIASSMSFCLVKGFKGTLFFQIVGKTCTTNWVAYNNIFIVLFSDSFKDFWNPAVGRPIPSEGSRIVFPSSFQWLLAFLGLWQITPVSASIFTSPSAFSFIVSYEDICSLGPILNPGWSHLEILNIFKFTGLGFRHLFGSHYSPHCSLPGIRYSVPPWDQTQRGFLSVKFVFSLFGESSFVLFCLIFSLVVLEAAELRGLPRRFAILERMLLNRLVKNDSYNKNS